MKVFPFKIASGLPHIGKSLFLLLALSCSDDPPPEEPIQESNSEQINSSEPEQFSEIDTQPVESDEFAELQNIAPSEPIDTSAPAWPYGYTSGYFEGTTYWPGVYNFGDERYANFRVSYSKQCDCVFLTQYGEEIGKIHPGDHPLIRFPEYDENGKPFIPGVQPGMALLHNNVYVRARAFTPFPSPRPRQTQSWRD